MTTARGKRGDTKSTKEDTKGTKKDEGRAKRAKINVVFFVSSSWPPLLWFSSRTVSMKKKDDGQKIVADNRKARHLYFENA